MDGVSERGKSIPDLKKLQNERVSLCNYDDGELSAQSVKNVESETPRWWWRAFAIAFVMFLASCV